MTRRKFSDYEKKTLYAKYNGRCAICGNPVAFKDMTVDHKTPLSKGGTNAMDNLQLACHSCNLMKTDFSVEEFTEKLSQVLWHTQMMKLKNFFVREVM